MPEHAETTVALHSDDTALLSRLAVLVARAPELRMAPPQTQPGIALIDERLDGAPEIVRRAADAPGLCGVLSDGTDPERLFLTLGAGADGCVVRNGDATVMTANLVAAAAGRWQLPGAAWPRLIELSATTAAETGAAAPAIGRDVLQDVIANRRFTMVFQPIVDVSTGAIAGLESLARFTAEPAHPPNVWLAEAERVDLRVRLEHELLRAAAATLPELPDHIAVSANLSAAAALDPALPAVLEGARLDRLVLEITDHRELGGYEPLSEALAGLRQAGLRLAVDDSGHGLSSLQHVALLAPSFMKLNRTLTHNADRDPTKRALAFALCTFASQLGAQVIAEGLETEGELRAVRALGVQFGQGYLVARPRPLAELELGSALKLPQGPDATVATPVGPQLELRGAALEDFREAVRTALRFLAELNPALTFAVAHLDYVELHHTVISARGPLAGHLDTGHTTLLADTMCFHMAAGDGPGLCPILCEETAYDGLPFARRLDAGAYVGVPLALPGGTRIGSIFAVTQQPEGVTSQDLALLDAVGAVLSTILVHQTDGMDPGELLRFLRNLARTDGLTGALNAPGFAQALATELRRSPAARTGSFVSVEIDDLTSVDRRYGRAVADLVLKDTAAALAVSTDQPDLVGRLGENRFGVLLTGRQHPHGVQHLRRNLAPRLADSAARREIAVAIRVGAVALSALPTPEEAWDAADASASLLTPDAA
jgi:diguanylate cyclase (GGDEF)-like protein